MNRWRLGTLLVACSAAVAVSSARSAHATTYSLDTLLSGGSNSGGLVIGNEKFFNFTYSTVGQGPAASAINVSTVASGSNNALSFTGSWYTLSASSGMESKISYEVALTDTTQAFNTMSTSFTGNSVGTGSATVDSTVADTSGNSVGTLDLSSNSNQNGDLAIPNNSGVSYTDIMVTHDIKVTAGSAGNAVISVVDTSFGTGTNNNGGARPPVVPEPMSLALIPLGLVGLGLRKRFSRSVA